MSHKNPNQCAVFGCRCQTPTRLTFPGGPVDVDRGFAERKLSEFLGPGRECHVTYHEKQWHCRLYVGADYYSASSTTGMLDAIANALMAAQGREEVV